MHERAPVAKKMIDHPPSHSHAAPEGEPGIHYYRAGSRQQGNPYLLLDGSIRAGEIVAVKGLGGYHLACDALNEGAVARLRKRKLRHEKPFAVMIRDVETVKNFCHLDPVEEAALRSAGTPIVLLRKREDCRIAREVAPNCNRLGVMLPYTPLHRAITESCPVLVMTSANISERPTIYDDEEAMATLFEIADALLRHGRKICRRMDDSVCMVAAGGVRMFRRSRGYAPEPLELAGADSTVLALGAQQKNTICLARGGQAFLSGHIGDLDDRDTESFFEAEIQSCLRRLGVRPEAIACDRHPDHVATRYAHRFRGELPIYEIQHHHAHLASVLAEHGIAGKALGLIFDGTGYGDDGTLWGGEALWGDVATSERIGHLLCAPLPGGEAAIREPWRMALSMLLISCGESAALDYFEQYGDRAALLLQACKQGLNSPATSGVGRLFDAVAALAGVRTVATYEGQAAMELEQVLDRSAGGSYGFDLSREGDMVVFDWRQLIRDVVRDARAGCSSGTISARFHRALVQLLVKLASLAEKRYDSGRVVLSGGVFQNAYLLGRGIAALRESGFSVHANARVPTNDGGISYGQAAAASRLLER